LAHALSFCYPIRVQPNKPKGFPPKVDHKGDLDRFETNIERLKVEYDQYFLGFTKVPPDKLRQETERMVRNYIGYNPPNTGFRFRAQNLVQRMATYRQLWDRTMQQIEDGTYKRDIFKANLKSRAAMEKPKMPAGHAANADDVYEDAEMFEEEAPAKPKWNSVYEQYVKARSETNEGTKGISYDKLHDVLEKQAAQLMSKYNAKDVEFKVVIEDGKARLKATPKR
jgi:hypothetical protein